MLLLGVEGATETAPNIMIGNVFWVDIGKLSARRLKIGNVNPESLFEGLLLKEVLNVIDGDVRCRFTPVPLTDSQETLIR